jgi:hypothetical protein
MKDFEVCPQMVSKSVAYIIYLHLLKGGTFSLLHFISALILIA